MAEAGATPETRSFWYAQESVTESRTVEFCHLEKLKMGFEADFGQASHEFPSFVT